MKQVRKTTLCGLVLCLLLSLLPIGTAWASATSGECGKSKSDQVSWTFYDGTLTISGNGEMENYDTAIDTWKAPWSGLVNQITGISVASGVTKIGSYAFTDCVKAATVKIPNTVTEIGRNAFWNCSALRSVVIPSSVISLRSHCFWNCVNLSYVELSEGVCELDSYAFDGCTSLVEISLPKSLSDIEIGCFAGCTALSTVTIRCDTAKINNDGAFVRTSDHLTIVCNQGSTAEKFAKENGYACRYISSGKTTDPDTTSWHDPFTDVRKNDWFYDGVAYANQHGLFAGTSANTFSPNANMTRQQMWMVLARISGKKPASMYAAQKWATENGVSDGSNPTSAVTREQFVTLLWRAAGSPRTTKNLSGYADFSSVASYAKEAMCWAVKNNIVSGTSTTTLSPRNGATRAQISVIITRYLNK